MLKAMGNMDWVRDCVARTSCAMGASGLLILLLSALAPTTSATLQPCTLACAGTAVYLGSGWRLACSGACPIGGPITENECVIVDKNDDVGACKVCLCSANGQESACCHTILRGGVPSSKGTCNASPPTSCVGGSACMDGNPDKDIIDFVCKNPP